MGYYREHQLGAGGLLKELPGMAMVFVWLTPDPPACSDPVPAAAFC